jgi:molybdenum cofactor synthesis domain-containing protein
MDIRTGIITISDRSSRGERPDSSGPTLADAARELTWIVSKMEIIPDDVNIIQKTLIEWCDSEDCDLILTTGGTGFSQRDVTPEATRQVIDRFAPGLDEAMRAGSRKINPHSMLSRGISGIRKSTLIINLPGNPNAALENIMIVKDVIPHAIGLLKNLPTTENEHQSLRKD